MHFYDPRYLVQFLKVLQVIFVIMESFGVKNIILWKFKVEMQSLQILGLMHNFEKF